MYSRGYTSLGLTVTQDNRHLKCSLEQHHLVTMADVFQTLQYFRLQVNLYSYDSRQLGLFNDLYGGLENRWIFGFVSLAYAIK